MTRLILSTLFIIILTISMILPVMAQNSWIQVPPAGDAALASFQRNGYHAGTGWINAWSDSTGTAYVGDADSVQVALYFPDSVSVSAVYAIMLPYSTATYGDTSTTLGTVASGTAAAKFDYLGTKITSEIYNYVKFRICFATSANHAYLGTEKYRVYIRKFKKQ
jgi:hypothetical protein